jgi:predicted RND superfamily exporter protein
LSSSKENSYILQKEIEEKFNLNADPVVAISPDLNAAQALYTGIQEHPDQYDTFDTLVSIYSFMPTAQRAHDNVEILEHFNAQLEKMHFSWNMLPEQFKKEQSWLEKAVHAKPYDIDKLPLEILQYFQTLPEAQPENRGFLTYIYPRVDLGNGKSLWRFADQATHIKTSAGNTIQAAGLPLLYARLAHMVIQDGLLTVFIASIWVFLMHLLDFRSPFLALISVLPLGIGLCMMLGVLNIIGSSLNFMNIVMLPILLGFGISHGLYILHRFLDGMPVYALMRSVGVAVFSSTSTAIAGFAALFASHHQGLRSMGLLACVGLSTTLWVSFTVLIGCLLWMEKKSKTPEI